MTYCIFSVFLSYCVRSGGPTFESSQTFNNFNPLSLTCLENMSILKPSGSPTDAMLPWLLKEASSATAPFFLTLIKTSWPLESCPVPLNIPWYNWYWRNQNWIQGSYVTFIQSPSFLFYPNSLSKLHLTYSLFTWYSSPWPIPIRFLILTQYRVCASLGL